MTTWTPKVPGGIRSQWAPEEFGEWKTSNLLVYSTQIKQVRLIHIENVYRYMHHYLYEEGWKGINGGDKHFEDFYGEYRDQQDHKEIRWWWRMEKNPGGIFGSHPYFQYKVYIDCLTVGMKRVEIMYKGKKIKPYMGEFLMWFNSILVLDKNNWFKKPPEGNRVLNILEDFFPRMIYKQRVREQEIELRRFSERFIEDVKFFIGMNRNAETRVPMEPENQWF
ncbi:hypothetical protein JXC34_04495 [Candidatus Woesearchaeota archaeon]|nr:hypothetical protein [Candidatus Woesearchaeota archaeon]